MKIPDEFLERLSRFRQMKENMFLVHLRGLSSSNILAQGWRIDSMSWGTI
jgi:hypothetical protein